MMKEGPGPESFHLSESPCQALVISSTEVRMMNSRVLLLTKTSSPAKAEFQLKLLSSAGVVMLNCFALVRLITASKQN